MLSVLEHILMFFLVYLGDTDNFGVVRILTNLFYS